LESIRNTRKFTKRKIAIGQRKFSIGNLISSATEKLLSTK
jgi:hypothetical protein